jgi:N-methylhydantoinase B/oxoprolinase/acetone carboxylase alpha subunit
MTHADDQDGLESRRHDADIKEFLRDATLFLGPDPEIMEDHRLAVRTPFEDTCMDAHRDPAQRRIVLDRLLAGVNESLEMLQQMGAAPGAKWGDCVSALFTASGDLTVASTGGVLAFCNMIQYPIKFINKYWVAEPSVRVREGDVFLLNDARYGQAHNTDQTMIMPIFWDGEIVGWAGSTVHEGENGAIEPGGMPSAAEQVWDEGLKISPIKVAENYVLRRDLVTFLQNSVREPKLQYADMKVKLFVCRRIEQRTHEAIKEYGLAAVVAAMRANLENTELEVRRRISEWPEGRVIHQWWADGTLRENVLLKFRLELTKKSDKLIFDYRGSSPEISNRPNNCLEITAKGMISQLFLTFIWPDLPRNQAVISPFEFIWDDPSALKPSFGTPNAQNMMSMFVSWSVGQVAVNKFLYSVPAKYTALVGPWYNMNNTFLFGGITQHGEMVGNICADINGCSGGALATRDGQNAVAPMFATMADFGEQELIEEELPFVQIVSKKLMRNNQGFGRHRGGMGYQMILSLRNSDNFGFMLTAIGAKFPNIPGIFGGYGCPTYPLARVSGVDIFDVLKTDPARFPFSIEQIMNERPFESARYSTHPMFLRYELAKKGELYMIAHGTGGGFGDVLERDPAHVLRDVEDELLDAETALRVYGVVYDADTLIVDTDKTQAARDTIRRERIAKSKPYDEFVRGWVTDGPSDKVRYFGSWEDPSMVYAGSRARYHPAGKIDPPVVLENPLEMEVNKLRRELAEANAKLAAIEL